MGTEGLTGTASSHCGSDCAWSAGSGCKNFYRSYHMRKVSKVGRQKHERKWSMNCCLFARFVSYQPGVFAVMSFQLPGLGKWSLAVEEGAHEVLIRIFETFSHFTHNEFTRFSLFLFFSFPSVAHRLTFFFFCRTTDKRPFRVFFINRGLYHYHTGRTELHLAQTK